MKFERYQHVERLGTDEVEGILNGTVYVFPKVDGSNFTAFIDDKGKPRAGSRNRIIDIGCDNQGACAYFMAQDKFKKFFEKYPTVRIFGEWLCVSGDALIRKTSAGKNGVYMTIRQMYNYMNTSRSDRKQSWWESHGFPQIFSLYQDEDIIKPNRIKNIIYSGNKVVYEVKTRKGFTIKTTKEHKFFTPFGYKPLSSLSVNDCVGVSGLITNRKARCYGKSQRFMNKQFSAYKDSVGNACEICGSKENIHLHHKDGDYKNNSIENFMALCKKCHMEHHKNDKKFTGFAYEYEFDKIISIKEIGVEDCYDITMEGTENEASFIGNGFILHNCPHTIKNYEDDAWKKIYIFDVLRDGKYLRYEEYKGMLEEFDIEYIPVLAVLNSPTEEEVRSLVDQATFLCKEGTYGEGVVCKNYDFVNKYGRITWAKVVRENFKVSKKVGRPIDYCTEVDIVEKLCTPDYIEKEFVKIANETGGFSSRMIPRLLGSVWHTFITEEAWNMVKKYKNPKIDFSLLNRLVTDKVKEVKKEYF